MDDTIVIKCPRCASRMRDRARRIVSGYTKQCTQCEGIIFFEESSPRQEVQDALRAAERMRRELSRAEESKLVNRAEPFAFRR